MVLGPDDNSGPARGARHRGPDRARQRGGGSVSPRGHNGSTPGLSRGWASVLVAGRGRSDTGFQPGPEWKAWGCPRRAWAGGSKLSRASRTGAVGGRLGEPAGKPSLDGTEYRPAASPLPPGANSGRCAAILLTCGATGTRDRLASPLRAPDAFYRTSGPLLTLRLFPCHLRLITTPCQHHGRLNPPPAVPPAAFLSAPRLGHFRPPLFGPGRRSRRPLESCARTDVRAGPGMAASRFGRKR